MSGDGVSTKGAGALRRFFQVRVSGEGDQVTTLELFFDLVFVFAFTQVTYVMSHGEAPLSVLQGLVILALLWWSWTSFTWLGNQTHADEGFVRAALFIAMGAVFILSLTIPEAYHDLEGGLYAPIVFVACYAVIRVVHLGTYVIAAGSDAVLRRQVVLSLLASALPAVVILAVGAYVDEQWRVWVWLGAIIVDLAAIYITSSLGKGWRVQSVAHFTERHRLIVILALGESIVAIGVGVSLDPITTEILVGSLLAIGISIALWWSYFVRIGEHADIFVERVDGAVRARVASDGYTYLHLPIIIGIILSALGVEEVMGHLEEDHLGWLGGSALGAGIAVFLIATALFWWRVAREWLWVRIIAAAVIAALIPVLSDLRGLWSLVIVLALLCTLSVVEAMPGVRRDHAVHAA